MLPGRTRLVSGGNHTYYKINFYFCAQIYKVRFPPETNLVLPDNIDIFYASMRIVFEPAAYLKEVKSCTRLKLNGNTKKSPTLS